MSALLAVVALSAAPTWVEHIFFCERVPPVSANEVNPPQSFEMTFQQNGNRLEGFQMSDPPSWLNGLADGAVKNGKYQFTFDQKDNGLKNTGFVELTPSSDDQLRMSWNGYFGLGSHTPLEGSGTAICKTAQAAHQERGQ